MRVEHLILLLLLIFSLFLAKEIAWVFLRWSDCKHIKKLTYVWSAIIAESVNIVVKSSNTSR